MLSVATFAGATCLAAESTPLHGIAQALTEHQKVERLIAYIRNMKDAKFIRNGSEHPPEQAADHLQAKYKKHAALIQTAEVFIEKLATKSSATGEVYKIKTANGEFLPLGQLLKQELNRINEATADKE